MMQNLYNGIYTIGCVTQLRLVHK